MEFSLTLLSAIGFTSLRDWFRAAVHSRRTPMGRQETGREQDCWLDRSMRKYTNRGFVSPLFFLFPRFFLSKINFWENLNLLFLSFQRFEVSRRERKTLKGEKIEIAEEKEICGREWKGEAKIYMGARNIIA